MLWWAVRETEDGSSRLPEDPRRVPEVFLLRKTPADGTSWSRHGRTGIGVLGVLYVIYDPKLVIFQYDFPKVRVDLIRHDN
jgi:hypothetical protein